MAVTKTPFGMSREGEPLTLYTLDNGSVSVQLTDLGATIVSIKMQDKYENIRDIVLGYDTPEAYMTNGGYLGAWVGRSGNRIDKAKFTLGGKTYQLPVNDNENNLHSGPDVFSRRRAEVVSVLEDAVTFRLKDASLQQGYPGSFTAEVTYTLTEDNALRMEYRAECDQDTVTYTLTDDNTLRLKYRAKCDQDTVCNMTNHSYFNLGGHDCGSMEDTLLQLNCEYYTPVIDHQAIPTGEYRPVKGTAFDFTQAKPIGQYIGADDEQLKFVGGYGHNFVIRKERGPVIKFAQAYQPKTGICMECYTDLPGVQFYAGNGIGEKAGKGGAVYRNRSGFCLETQFYPNSINQDGFAKPILKAGEEFKSVTTYKFSVK